MAAIHSPLASCCTSMWCVRSLQAQQAVWWCGMWHGAGSKVFMRGLWSSTSKVSSLPHNPAVRTHRRQSARMQAGWRAGGKGSKGQPGRQAPVPGWLEVAAQPADAVLHSVLLKLGGRQLRHLKGNQLQGVCGGKGRAAGRG